MIKKIAAFIVPLALTACADIVIVKKEEVEDGKKVYKKIAGIPFYKKTAQYTQKTTYDLTWLKVTLSVEKQLAATPGTAQPAGKIPPKTFERNFCISEISQLDQLKKAIIAAESGSVDGTVLIDKFIDFPLSNLSDHAQYLRKCGNPSVSQNTIETALVVDTDHPYYLNAPLPWFGTGSLTQKLSGEGTLSEATASADTKVADGISSLIPLKDYLSGKFVKKAGDDADVKTTAWSRPVPVRANLSVELSLKIEQVGYEYTFTKILSPDEAKKDGNFVAQKALVFSPDDHAFSRKIIKPASGDEKKEEGKKIGISGNIEFPKDWGASK